MNFLPGVLSQQNGNVVYLWDRYTIVNTKAEDSKGSVTRNKSYSKYASSEYTLHDGIFELTNPVKTTFANMTNGTNTVDMDDNTSIVTSGDTLFTVSSNSGVEYERTETELGQLTVTVDATESHYFTTAVSFGRTTGYFESSNVTTKTYGSLPVGFTCYTTSDGQAHNNYQTGFRAMSVYKCVVTKVHDGSKTTFSRTKVEAKQTGNTVIGYTAYKQKQEPGTYIDTVKSKKRAAYPTNGAQGGYWYVLKHKSGEYLNYLQSTGTQYIRTGFIPNQDTRIVCKAKVPLVGDTWLFGARANNATKQFCFVYSATYGCYTPKYGTATLYIDKSINTSDGELLIDFNKNTVSVTLDETTSTKTATYNSFTAPGELCLFANNQNGTISCAASTIYYLQIYDNGTLVRDFRPRVDDEGEACMFDEISGEYFRNAGTGIFLAA